MLVKYFEIFGQMDDWLVNGDGKDLHNGSICFIGPLVYIYIFHLIVCIYLSMYFSKYMHVHPSFQKKHLLTLQFFFVKYTTKNGTFEKWSLDSKIFREDGFRFQVLSPVKRMFFAVGKRFQNLFFNFPYIF